MSYQLYRNTTLGHTLQEALDELMQLQLLSPTLALKVLLQFDKSINTALNTRLANTYSQIHLFRVFTYSSFTFHDHFSDFHNVLFVHSMKLLKWHLMQPRFCNKQALTSVDESSKVWRNLASCCDFGHSSHSSFPLSAESRLS